MSTANRTTFNHLAILVRSVDRAAKVLAELGYPIGPREEWDGEGTAEIYVGSKDQAAKLLLMEPVKPGAYSRAMEKRGPGLHHVAVDVRDLEEFVTGLSGSGWYLHPKSLRTIRSGQTAWLARPGTGMLIEVQQREDLADAAPFITGIDVPLTPKERGMVAALGIEQLRASDDDESWLVVGKHRINLADLLA